MGVVVSEYLYYFLLLVLVLGLSYLMGTFYLKFYLRRKSITTLVNVYAQISERLIFGLTIIISLVAIVCTQGLTVQWFNVFALLSLKFLLSETENNLDQSKEKNNREINKYDAVILLFLTASIYIFHIFGLYILNDHVYYGKLSAGIFESGQEHINAAYSSFQEIGGIDLYHFAELWLTGFLAKVFSLNHLFVLTSVVYPVYHLLVFILILGFFYEHYSRLKSLLFSFSILYGTTILFVTFLSPEQGHYTFWYYGIPDITAFKCLPLYPFIILGFHYLKITNWYAFAILLLIGVVNYITILPAFFGSASFCLLYLFFLKKNKKAAGALLLFLSAVVFMLVFVYVVNLFFPSVKKEGGIIHYIYPIRYYFENFGTYLELFINYFARPIYYYPFVTIGIILLWRRDFSEQSKTILLFAFSSLITASLFITFFFNFKNGTQSLSMIIPPLMIFLSYVLFEYLKKKEAFFVGVGLFILAIFNFVSIGAFDKVQNNRSPQSTSLLDFAETHLKDQKWAYYSKRHWSTWNYNNNIVGNPILLVDLTILPLEIAPYFKEEGDRQVYLKKNPDYPLRNIHLDKEKRITKLIKYFLDNDIRYVFFENHELANEEFLNYLEPIIMENKSSVWHVK